MPENIFLTFPVDETNYNFNRLQSIPSIYFAGDNRLGKFIIGEEVQLNEAMIKFAEKSGSFDFLSNPTEDIYTFDDGEEI